MEGGGGRLNKGKGELSTSPNQKVELHWRRQRHSSGLVRGATGTEVIVTTYRRGTCVQYLQ